MNNEVMQELNRGVESFNRWREKNPDVEIDLNGSFLIERDLCGINLSNACMVKTKMVKVKLRGADLSGAILVESDMRMADLSNANLHNADLTGADLTGANLERADIKNTIFHHTDTRYCRVDREYRKLL